MIRAAVFPVVILAFSQVAARLLQLTGVMLKKAKIAKAGYLVATGCIAVMLLVAVADESHTATFYPEEVE